MRRRKRITSDISKVFVSEILPYETVLNFNYEKNANLPLNLSNVTFNNKDFTIPYSYKTFQNGKDRILSIPHDDVQKQIVKFYHEYYSLILYYTNISKFSIRKPVKKATSFYYNDIIHDEKHHDNHPFVEQDKYEYTRYHSFFSYQKYQQIHQFYQSKEFQNMEKLFPLLVKFDISRCFDSIYTHSISWAIYGKNYAKTHIKCKNFANIFDSLMQNCNYRETHGIIIGSELSRLFAEIILQRIDKNIEQKLDMNYKLKFRYNYVIYRYVDDFFLFCSPLDKDTIMGIIKEELANYKLFINDKKTIEFSRPFITEKTKIKTLIQEFLSKELILDNLGDKDSICILKINSTKIITRLNIIVVNSEGKYDGISNYILGICENFFLQVINQVNLAPEKFDPRNVNDTLHGILDIMFFIITDTKYSSFNYISRILVILMEKVHATIQKSQRNTRTSFFTTYYKKGLFQKIYDEILILLNKNSRLPTFYVEYWNLFIILYQLKKYKKLSPKELNIFIDLDNVYDDCSQNIYRYDYFALTTILFYIKKDKLYNKIQEKVMSYIELYKKYLQSKYSTDLKNITEYQMLEESLAANPYLPTVSQKANIESYTMWKKFNFINSIDKKRRFEVY